MSPVGGVGINLAIQDAVATANILAPHLRNGTPGPEVLRLVQRRRETPTRLTQGMQRLIQNAVIRPVLSSKKQPHAPLPLRTLTKLPRYATCSPASWECRFLPEHIRSPAWQP